MFTIRSLLFGVGLLVWPALLIAQTPSEVIRKAIEELGTLPANDEEIAQAASATLDTMSSKEVVDALFRTMKRPQEVTNQRRTLNVLVGNLKNFDIDAWLALLEAETDPMMLNYGVRVAKLSQKADSPRLKTLMQRLLADKRIGEEVRGEARAYSSNGLRVCDIMMNSLWSREPEASRPPGYPVDAGTSLQRRDELIAAYVTKFNVSLPPKEPNSRASESSSPSTRNKITTPKKAPSTTPFSSPSENLTSSTPWSIAAVLIVTVLGLLGLQFKRRK